MGKLKELLREAVAEITEELEDKHNTLAASVTRIEEQLDQMSQESGPKQAPEIRGTGKTARALLPFGAYASWKRDRDEEFKGRMMREVLRTLGFGVTLSPSAWDEAWNRIHAEVYGEQAGV